MVVVSGSREIGLDALGRGRLPIAQGSAEGKISKGPVSLRAQLAAYERRIIARALAAAMGNRAHAARPLGLGRTSLFDRLKKYELSIAVADPDG